jgi:hypothetical protein
VDFDVHICPGEGGVNITGVKAYLLEVWESGAAVEVFGGGGGERGHLMLGGGVAADGDSALETEAYGECVCVGATVLVLVKVHVPINSFIRVAVYAGY